VTTLDDSLAEGTLRWAITQANQPNTGDDTITFAPGLTGTITLNSALPDLSDTTGRIDIEGPGATALTVARSSEPGTPDFRIFTVDAGVKAKLDGLTITGGQADQGGGIINEGDLTIAGCTIKGNRVGFGVILNWEAGSLTIIDTSIDSNLADEGCGVVNYGTFEIAGSAITNNRSGSNFSGGGIVNLGTGTVLNCTIAYNWDSVSGGIANWGGEISVIDSTIAYNRMAYAMPSSEPGGGVRVLGGTVTLMNSIVALNFGAVGEGAPPSDIDGTVSSTSANNLIGTGGSGGLVDGVNGNLVGVVDPQLGPLQDNGGPTWSVAPLPGSPAIDAGSNDLIPPGVEYDQRGPGFQRIVNATGKPTAIVDIGAVEWQPYVSSFAATWGAQTAPLKPAADGLRLLPVGRKTDLPWQDIKQLTITLSTAEPLTPGDVTVSSTSGTKYGPVTLSGSGTSYTIKLAQPIAQADRVTIRLNLGGLVSPTFEVDVLPGDVNDDGIVNAQDMVLIRNAIQQTGDPLMIGWADVDGNGVLDVNDYIAARKRLGSRLH
jgi:hypothetical protein